MPHRILDLAQERAWLDALARLPASRQDVYFTPAYYRMHERAGDGRALCFVFEAGREVALYPFLENSVNALGLVELARDHVDVQGAYGYGGVASSTDAPEFREAFHRAWGGWCRERGVIAEFTRFHPLLDNRAFSAEFLETSLDRDTVFVDLARDPEAVRRDYSDACRRAIRKAERRGVSVRRVEGDGARRSFRELYRATMDRVGAIEALYFGTAYFEELFRLPSLVQLAAFVGDRIVASALCFHSSDYFHYHLGASDAAYLDVRPNNALFDAMIACARETDCRQIHFGGGRTRDPGDSLLRFKSHFSDARAQFHIGKRIHDAEVYRQVVDAWSVRYARRPRPPEAVLLRYRNIEESTGVD